MEENLLNYCSYVWFSIYVLRGFICLFVTKSLFAFSYQGNASNTKQFNKAVEELLQLMGKKHSFTKNAPLCLRLQIV